MRAVGHVAGDLLREALSRKWFMALGGVITLGLVLVLFSLRFEVVDGALATTRLFGEDLGGRGEAVELALRAIFEGSAWVVFYGGVTFGIVACSDFGPSLLVPGRIELLLSLPLRRWELLVGTWIGVLMIATLGAVYGAGGLTLILGWKAGVWTIGPVVAAGLASLSFSAIYAAMLAVSLWVRSAALSAAAGFLLFFAGIIAGYRDSILPAFKPGAGREIFRVASGLVPRISSLADDARAIAGSRPVDLQGLAFNVGGLLLFAAAALALATWRFEGRDS